MEHPNPNQSGYRDNYTNFDQFLNQYNNASIMASNNASTSTDPNNIQYLPYDNYQIPESCVYEFGNELNNFQVENSNLLPTAAEFVPRWDQKYQAPPFELSNNDAARPFEYFNGNFDQFSYESGESQLEFANLGEINNVNSIDSVEIGNQQQPQQNRGSSTSKWGSQNKSNTNNHNQLQSNKNNVSNGQKNYNNRSDQRGLNSVVYERGRNRYDDDSSSSNSRRRNNRYESRNQQQSGSSAGGGNGRYRNDDKTSNGKWESERGNYRNNYKEARNYDRNEWRSISDDNNDQKYNDKESGGNTGRNFNLTTKSNCENNKIVTEHSTLKAEAAKFDDDKFTQREKLSREIDGGNLECLVCCENIKPFQSTWSCNNCFHIIHLNCTIKWAASSKSDEGWRCPACQNVTKRVPRDYYCFCGKTKNPQYNRNDMAHTCGELCEHIDNCVHPCTQLCHPGPCPPCQTSVTRYCGCGKSSRMMQCNQKILVKCDLICDKNLNCQIHQCLEKCHEDDCKKCQNKVEHLCHCGKETKNVNCTLESNKNLNYSCNKTCNKLLNCKNHNCQRNCHSGNCGDCKLSTTSITSCPCGKVPIIDGQRLSCLDPIPLCGGVCQKLLKCGPTHAPHSCSSRCHTGNCPPCAKETSIKCRCGHMDQMIKCRQLMTRADDARCKKRCVKKRNCGKHKCNQECCIDIDHICPMPCTFTLSCGKHKCDQTCHKGRCIPCYRSSFDELYCECGAEVIYPPVPCGTKRPECNRKCTRTHICNHEVLHNCHNQTTCPPCMILSTVPCYGKHEIRKTIPCSQGEFSCGLSCNKPLDCKQRHKCIKTCHLGVCMTVGEICKQNCIKIRSSCVHKCNAPCHSGECPIDIPCKENVEVTCQCGNRKQTRSCHDFASDYRRIATSQLASSMQEMQRGNSVELSDILGPIKINNNKTLECNDDCKTLERNRRLAIGLQIRNPDLSSKLQPRYSEFLRAYAKKDNVFVQKIHDKLTELVKLAKESKQRSRSHSFPTMNREKRQVVHEMCGMFGVDSIAYDAEPNRNVVATAYKEKTWMPSMSLSEVLKREGGQRRIPVPNMNAWGIKR